MNRKKKKILHYKITEYLSCKGSTRIIIPKGQYTHTNKINQIMCFKSVVQTFLELSTPLLVPYWDY